MFANCHIPILIPYNSFIDLHFRVTFTFWTLSQTFYGLFELFYAFYFFLFVRYTSKKPPKLNRRLKIFILLSIRELTNLHRGALQ